MSLKHFLIGLTSTLLFTGILLAGAGRMDYAPAWVYAAISLAMNLLTRSILAKNPALAEERAKPAEGAAWDKKLLGIGFLLTLVLLVVAGLDAGRFHWTPVQPPWTCALGALINLIGMGLFLWAMRENAFFSSVVRIQKEREHRVCTTGPYRLVRHPGNLGMIVGTLGLPLLFMSFWSLIPALLMAANLVIRTHLEDRLLGEELEGYRDYQGRTRFKLIPGIG